MMLGARTAAWAKAKSGDVNPYQTEDNALVLCYDPDFSFGTNVEFAGTGAISIPFISYPDLYQSGMTVEMCIDHTYDSSTEQVDFLSKSWSELTIATQPIYLRWFCRWSPLTAVIDQIMDTDMIAGNRYAHTLAIGCKNGMISYQAKDGGEGYLYDSGENFTKPRTITKTSFSLLTSRLSFRVYNRVLTQEELLVRWNTDNSRFDLT